MIYQYIHDEDLYQAIKKEVLERSGMGSAAKIKRAEKAALAEMKSKINGRYNIGLIFLKIEEWDEEAEYAEGDYVYYAAPVYEDPEPEGGPVITGYLPGVIYKAIEGENAGIAPNQEDNTKWEEEDPRDPLVVTYCVYILLFHLHRSINPRLIPDNVPDNYEMAMQWLDDIKELRENPDLPLNEAGNNLPLWGKRQNWNNENEYRE